MNYILNFEEFLNESQNEVNKLKKELKTKEEWFPKYAGKVSPEEYEKKAEEVRAIRKKLFDLTGDPYGETKKKVQKQINKDLLDATYDHPSEVPEEVFEYISLNGNLLTNDASDAVRWSRIIDTENEERYSSGEYTIYRATERGDYDEIRPGDWVTTDEKYAKEHNRKYFDGVGVILSMDVDGRDILVSPTGNYEEAIYAPRKLSKPLNYWKNKNK